MALYLIKPVVWNDEGYRRPSGAKFISGYPAEHGFGHEEWNNSDWLYFSEGGEQLKIFHTEGFGKQPLSDFDGRIFVFMVASFKGTQYLVSIGGRATSLFSNEEERRRLADDLDLFELWKDAWRLPGVQQKHKGASEFRRFWKKEYHWVPTWICPADCYLALKQPVPLDPQSLIGRRKFTTMYSKYQEIDRHLALRILDRVPSGEDGGILANLRLACEGSRAEDQQDDVARIERMPVRPTTRKALVDARLGQGAFRNDLVRIWEGRCAVTGCSVEKVLRASHVRPWRASTNRERLDPQNGLLLSAHLDALFDAGLISFDDDGVMLVSDQITPHDRQLLGLVGRLAVTPSDELKSYLKYHREDFARRRAQQKS